MSRVHVIALAILLAGCFATSTTSAGISVPAGSDLDRFDLRERCGPRDSSCTDRALEIAGTILQSLGPANPPAPLPAPGLMPFTIQVDRDPAWEWRSADGSGGSTANAVIDLDAFLSGDGDAVVRIGGDDPGYPIPPALAQQLVDALFIQD